ncbi:hypothetical protein [Sphingomonas aerophila]|uniref:Uncharacterized protein n=1 Tax=Sphingomonas aerophila TaxID=1344948 RepID=A0A7W9EW94_9SPHN|nr:hypothetical protein [Sphingomonas aerophila]MBB5717066.1 hypothetical protein [Sphingomonas aerophila]
MCADIAREGVAAFLDRTPVSAIRFPILAPPAWTRLEPQSLSGEPAQALTARVHDPLWLLARQWQFGEFDGEDAGTPVAVELTGTARRFTAFAPEGQPARTMTERDLIEPEVEAEPFTGATLRDRAEGGALLAAMLEDAGASVRSALATACPLAVPDDGGIAAPVPAMWRLLARGGIDGSAAAKQVEDGSFAASWAAGTGELALQAARDWLEWYRANVQPSVGLGDCWRQARLEYDFSVRAGAPEDRRVCRAVAHDGGPVDWYSFDHEPGDSVAVEGEAPGTAPEPIDSTVHATRLRYAGMPASRLRRFEDGQVNFGMVEVQPHDLARLAFLDFATVHADDWLIAPLDVPRGAVVEMTSVQYRTTFNERFSVEQGNTGVQDFELFTLDGSSGEALRGLLVPPGGRTAMEGAPVEEVVFARDETANMVWAIENRVQGPTGDPRDRTLEPRPADEFVTPEAADLTYRLETVPPGWWIPLVPVANGRSGGFHLRKGSFTDADASLGRILAPLPLDMFEEEVPREGVVVRRVPSLMRDNKGHLRRWTARRVSVAHGGASAGFTSDSALRR